MRSIDRSKGSAYIRLAEAACMWSIDRSKGSAPDYVGTNWKTGHNSH